jgi:hypothetical protein
MTFTDWKQAVVAEYRRQAGYTLDDATMYVEEVGDETWREAYDDGLSPADVVSEDLAAGADCIAEE